MSDFSGVSTDALVAASRNMRLRRGAPARSRGVGDFDEPHITAIRPNDPKVVPPGPADFPAQVPPQPVNDLNDIGDLLKRILQELINQSIAAAPVIRAKAVTSAGQTLDWSSRGTMDRLMIRNKGTNSVWFAFDMNGPAVNAFTSDLSFELQANESVNLSLCSFQKIGVICASGQTGTVHAIAFQSVAGNQAASIS